MTDCKRLAKKTDIFLFGEFFHFESFCSAPYTKKNIPQRLGIIQPPAMSVTGHFKLLITPFPLLFSKMKNTPMRSSSGIDDIYRIDNIEVKSSSYC